LISNDADKILIITNSTIINSFSNYGGGIAYFSLYNLNFNVSGIFLFNNSTLSCFKNSIQYPNYAQFSLYNEEFMKKYDFNLFLNL
jgi:hypothetical protein